MSETSPDDAASTALTKAMDELTDTQAVSSTSLPNGEPAASALPSRAEPAHPLPWQLNIHPKEHLMTRISSAFWFAVLGVGPSIPLCVALGLDAWTLLVASIAAALGIWLGIRYGRAYERLYEVHQLADGLLVKRGVFWRSETFVPRSRIQHTDVNQGPLDRRWGMATLTLHTAGTHVEKIEVAGLYHPDAISLRDDLLDRHEGSDGA